MVRSGRSRIPVGTRDTVTRVRGIARVCELSYRTRTRQTRDLKPAGFPVPVTNPSQHRLVLLGVRVYCCVWYFFSCPYRIKDKLHSSEMAVSGDQWPIFLYHGYWNGLFQSTVLMSVHIHLLQCIIYSDMNFYLKHTNTYLHL